MRVYRITGLAAVAALLASGIANAQMRITEWQYNGSEYIEFTNLGASEVDMSGWSFSDSNRAPGNVSLSAFGIVLPGESVLLTEEPAAGFRTRWGLPLTVDIIGGNSQNLGREDEINLYDNLSALVDRLTYGDEVFDGTIRTQNVSGNPSTPAVMEADTVGAPGDWVLSEVGDRFGSYLSATGGFIGNPGINIAVPEPASIALMAIGFAALGWRRRS